MKKLLLVLTLALAGCSASSSEKSEFSGLVAGKTVYVANGDCYNVLGAFSSNGESFIYAGFTLEWEAGASDGASYMVEHNGDTYYVMFTDVDAEGGKYTVTGFGESGGDVSEMPFIFNLGADDEECDDE